MTISWTTKKIEHKNSLISGTGVFAKRKINRGEIVAVFGGYCIDIDELKKLETENPSAHDVILEIGYQIEDNIIFSPTSKPQFSIIEYLNHSCDANCGFDGPINLIALHDIDKGEEISMDYATCITSKLFEMKCVCGSSKCRGRLRATDWKLPSVQKQYKSHFQPYIIKKIKRLKSLKK